MRRPTQLLCLLAMAACGVAQERQATPKFSTRTELVTVPVVVLQKGKFLGGLKGTDFTVLEDGRARSIAFFEEVQAGPARQSPPSAPGEYTNTATDADEAVPITAILLDSVFTPSVAEFNNARREAIKFVEGNMRPGDLMMAAIIEPRGLRVLHDFTGSPPDLIAALKGVPRGLQLRPEVQQVGPVEAGKPGFGELTSGVPGDTDRPVGTPVDVQEQTAEEKVETGFDNIGPSGAEAMRDVVRSVNQREQEQKVSVVLMAVEQLAHALAGMPGRKALLWTSPGFVCPFGGGWMRTAKGMQTTVQQCENIWRLLSAGNISVYPVNPQQTVNPTYSGTNCVGACAGGRPVLRELMLQSFAQYTGGTVCSYRNDLDTCFKRALDDAARYYLLSYYTDPTPNPVWHKLRVKVRVSGVSVRSRMGFLTAGAARSLEEQKKSDMEAAIVSPLEYKAIPFGVRWMRAFDEDGRRKYSFRLRIPASAISLDEAQGNHVRFELASVALTSAGQITFTAGHNLESHLAGKALADFRQYGLVYENATELPEGTYRVKFIVRDALSGKIGTVTTPVPRVKQRD